MPPGLDGTLAPDILSTFDVEFDFKHGKMNFFRQKHCPGQVVYWTAQPFARVPLRVSTQRQISVDAELDGHQARATLDTGSPWTILSLEATRHEFGWDKDPLGLKPAPGEKATDPHAYVYPFSKITLGEIAVDDPAITLVPDKYAGFGRQRFEPIVGISILRQLHVYIAYGEGYLYATSATRIEIPPSPKVRRQEDADVSSTSAFMVRAPATQNLSRFRALKFFSAITRFASVCPTHFLTYENTFMGSKHLQDVIILVGGPPAILFMVSGLVRYARARSIPRKPSMPPISSSTHPILYWSLMGYMSICTAGMMVGFISVIADLLHS